MALTADAYKLLIIDECKDVDDILTNNIDDWWLMFEDIDPIYRRYLYVKRHALVALIRQVSDKGTLMMRDNSVQERVAPVLSGLELALTQVERQIEVYERQGSTGTSGGWGRTLVRA